MTDHFASSPVYFDTSTIDHLYKRDGVTDADVRKLLRAAKTKRIKVLASDALVEELLATVESKRIIARGEIGLLLQISNVRRDLMKPHEEMVLAEIKAFADGKPLPGHLIDAERGKKLEKLLRRFAEEDVDPAGLWEGLAETRLQKESIRNGLVRAREAVQKEKGKLKGSFPDFASYLGPMSAALVNGLAQMAGIPREPAEKLTPGLLGIPTVGMFGRASAALVYAQTFEGRTPKVSDSRDLMHAMVSTKAKTFVTDDTPLRNILSRVPMDDYEVMSLPEFVNRLSGAPRVDSETSRRPLPACCA